MNAARPRALVLFNPAAHGGRGGARFRGVRPTLDAVCQPRVVTLSADTDWPEAIREAIADGTRWFIAAGGDGTVNALVNTLADQRGEVPLAELCVGAIGLGSSNDYHKPVDRLVAGVPVRLDHHDAAPRDLMRATWENGSAVVAVSASLGFTARANATFNEGDRVLRFLKKWSTDLAILWAAARTLMRHQNLSATLTVDGQRAIYALTNLSVMKTPWLSGGFHYDTPIAPSDGWMAVNLLEGLGRIGVLRALIALSRGRFVGIGGAVTMRARRVDVELEAPAALELDGELHQATRIRFELLPKAIRVCP